MLSTILLVLLVVVMLFGCCRGMFRSGRKGGSSCGMSNKQGDAGKSADKQMNNDENNPNKKNRKGGCC